MDPMRTKCGGRPTARAVQFANIRTVCETAFRLCMIVILGVFPEVKDLHGIGVILGDREVHLLPKVVSEI
jgi:hypothetical protein